jgi:hypothetical protein
VPVFRPHRKEKTVQEKVPPVPGGRRTRKFFDKAEFNALHEAVGKLDFTPDFNPSIEYIFMIEEVPLTERLLALLKLQAWGNQKQLAVHDDNRTKPFTQADAARKLDVSRQRIYEAAVKLVKRCQLRIEGQSLYPVADPAAEYRNRGSESTRNGSGWDAHSFRLWLLEHPELAEDYREAFQTIGSIKRQFRQETVSGTERENGAPPPPRSGQESSSRPDTSEDTDRTAEPPIIIEEQENNSEEPSSSSTVEEAAPEPQKTTTTPTQSNASAPEPPSAEKEESKEPGIVSAALRPYGNPDDDAVNSLVDACRSNAPDATAEEIAHFVREKGKLITRKIANPVGFLLTAVPKCFVSDSFREYREQRTRERSQQAAREAEDPQAAERLRKEGEADLANPNISEEEKRLIRRCLGLDDPGKAAEFTARAVAAEPNQKRPN